MSLSVWALSKNALRLLQHCLVWRHNLPMKKPHSCKTGWFLLDICTIPFDQPLHLRFKETSLTWRNVFYIFLLSNDSNDNVVENQLYLTRVVRRRSKSGFFKDADKSFSECLMHTINTSIILQYTIIMFVWLKDACPDNTFQSCLVLFST